ncbi:unnamed protein product (macronuclear) [Paramecium tetraurelia]|uniref:Protein kinase domain-containing protein n=1 Tax=Paramecium tetraurelia TaxID=5888 RepID=A0CYA5_PARTE|nr:uncharacterized protein GSPATT00011372001 [Paramecium tetraurelia]CAK75772.1 unnamed protein product [Paramecium tetraurelia]|eukprot:XP_001443169.1 hypothetical protein (macronuclear) [Paramecium tetraurelia strain d4-2]
MSKNNTTINLTINQLKDQWKKSCKNEIVPQFVRQPSINQIRISKNNRSSNYGTSPIKLSTEQIQAPKTLKQDNFSLESTISISSQIFKVDSHIESKQIQPTPQIKMIMNQEHSHINVTTIMKIEDESNSKEQIQISNVQTGLSQFRIINISNDIENPINCLDLQFQPVVFQSSIQQHTFQKKAESNKITHKMYMMQKLNKFKKDEMNKKIIKHDPLKQSSSLKPELQLKIVASQSLTQIKKNPIQQEKVQDQQENKLDYEFQKSTMSNEIYSFVSAVVQPKIQNFRQPLQQDQDNQSVQKLNFQTEATHEIKQYFVQTFPTPPLKLQRLKMETVNMQQNSLDENNKLLKDQPTKESIQTKTQPMKLKQDLLKKDQIPLFQLFILIGDGKINEKKVKWGDQIPIKNCPLSTLNSNAMKSDQIDSSVVKVCLSQNILQDRKINLDDQSKQTFQTKSIKLSFLIKDYDDKANQAIKCMIIPLQFNENLLKVNYEIVQPKEKPQYPTLLQMNRMKIEKIKELITEGKTSRTAFKIKQFQKHDSNGIQIRQVTETNGSEKKYVQHGSLILEESKEIQVSQRCSSIDKATSKIKTSKNQFSILNRFQKIKYLGRGNVSDAYSVFDQQTGMALALKTIQKSLIQSKGISTLISNEIKTQMVLNHPNILKCYGIIGDNKQIALILELSDYTLYNLIRQKTINRKEMIDILHQVIGAVNHLHKNGIIHRDIKPENILISQNVIKLADLGISIRAYSCSQYCGTQGYMAPEIKLHEKYTSKVDCYSIGVLIYEMLYKKLPLQTLYPIKNAKNDLLIDLMNNLIEPNQDLRYSCSQALDHEIFNQLIYPQLIQTSILNNLKKLL